MGGTLWPHSSSNLHLWLRCKHQHRTVATECRLIWRDRKWSFHPSLYLWGSWSVAELEHYSKQTVLYQFHRESISHLKYKELKPIWWLYLGICTARMSSTCKYCASMLFPSKCRRSLPEGCFCSRRLWGRTHRNRTQKCLRRGTLHWELCPR